MEKNNKTDYVKRNRWFLIGIIVLACSIIFHWLESIIPYGFGLFFGLIFYVLTIIIFISAIYLFDVNYKATKIFGIIIILLFFYFFVRL